MARGSTADLPRPPRHARSAAFILPGERATEMNEFQFRIDRTSNHSRLRRGPGGSNRSIMLCTKVTVA
jgi:hypothetical protein